MTNPHGTFIWYELMTTDAEAAERFYSAVVGWSVGSFDGAPTGYRILSSVGGGGVGGIMALPEGAAASGMRPGWFGYIGVDDVDAAAAAVTEGGGAVHMPPTDLPGVGRFAFVADPQGVLFYLMRGASPEASGAYNPKLEGHCSWHELGTSDPAAALDFYLPRYGWDKGGAMPMGEANEYRFIEQGGAVIGAVTRTPEPGPPPAWNFYFRVADIDAAVARIGEAGGQVRHGPMEVPGSDHIVIGSDPQGATFSLVGKKAG